MTESTIEAIEITREEAKKEVALFESFNRLRLNKDFQKIIEEEYFEKEAIRLVHLKSHPSQTDQESQKAIDNAMMGIGELRQFFSKIIQRGFQMKKTLEDCDTEIALIHEEQAGE